LIGVLAEFFVNCGISRREVAQSLNAVARRIRRDEVVAPWHESLAEFIKRVSEAYSAWWTDPGFLDQNGCPIPLAESGVPRSIRALLGLKFAPNEVDTAIQVLSESPSISRRSDGFWVAKEQALIVPSAGEFSFHRVIAVIRGLLGTYHANNFARRPGEGRLERTIMSGDVPARALPALRTAVREHLGDSLLAMLQLVRNAEQAHGRRAGKEIGIEVFMYELPAVSTVPTRPNRAADRKLRTANSSRNKKKGPQRAGRRGPR
jgi:hypothetical protein